MVVLEAEEEIADEGAAEAGAPAALEEDEEVVVAAEAVEGQEAARVV